MFTCVFWLDTYFLWFSVSYLPKTTRCNNYYYRLPEDHSPHHTEHHDPMPASPAVSCSRYAIDGDSCLLSFGSWHLTLKNIPPPVKGDSWEEVMKAVNKYDRELCKGWNKEVDSTLVFVGNNSNLEFLCLVDKCALQASLFSATVTAFTV